MARAKGKPEKGLRPLFLFLFIEFIVRSINDDKWKRSLKLGINSVLEAENAVYRVVGDEVVQISDETEISTVEEALGNGSFESGKHLQRALELLSDRQAPDYRNSIKESISIYFCCGVCVPTYRGKRKGNSRDRSEDSEDQAINASSL